MKKISLCLVLFLFCQVFVAAQIAPVFKVPKLELLNIPYNGSLNTENICTVPILGNDDLSVVFGLSWNKDYLHVEAYVIDDVFFNNHAGELWDGDSLTLWLGEKQFIFAGFEGEPARGYLWSADTKGPVQGARLDFRLEKQQSSEKAASALGSQFSGKPGWVLKADLPWSLLGIEGTQLGKVLEMGLGIYDKDQKDFAKDKLVTFPSGWAWENKQSWQKVCLADEKSTVSIKPEDFGEMVDLAENFNFLLPGTTVNTLVIDRSSPEKFAGDNARFKVDEHKQPQIGEHRVGVWSAGEETIFTDINITAYLYPGRGDLNQWFVLRESADNKTFTPVSLSVVMVSQGVFNKYLLRPQAGLKPTTRFLELSLIVKNPQESWVNQVGEVKLFTQKDSWAQ